jgi:hypothetical protein
MKLKWENIREVVAAVVRKRWLNIKNEEEE